jgi:hypothetical protein
MMSSMARVGAAGVGIARSLYSHPLHCGCLAERPRDGAGGGPAHGRRRRVEARSGADHGGASTRRLRMRLANDFGW